jgi:hypothetical protein
MQRFIAIVFLLGLASSLELSTDLPDDDMVELLGVISSP